MFRSVNSKGRAFARGSTAEGYTPAELRVATFCVCIRRSYIGKYNFVQPAMETLYQGPLAQKHVRLVTYLFIRGITRKTKMERGGNRGTALWIRPPNIKRVLVVFITRNYWFFACVFLLFFFRRRRRGKFTEMVIFGGMHSWIDRRGGISRSIQRIH